MCNLKGSCDKAYVIAKEDEPAQTVDVIHIILTYAVNSAALSGVENPPVNLQIQESARKLLSELIKVSDTTIDPALPKPVVQSPSQKEPSQKSVSKNNSSHNVEMKRGDWLCALHGMYMMEVDRVLRHGGYWILSGPPIYCKSYYKTWKRSKDEVLF